MKKSRSGDSKYHSSSNNNKCIDHTKKRIEEKSKGSSFYELSLSLILSFWCLLFLLYMELGHGHGNGGHFISGNESMTMNNAGNDGLCNDVTFSDGVNRSDNNTIKMFLGFNMSRSSKNSTVQYNSKNSQCSLPETNELEELLAALGFTGALVCEVPPQKGHRANQSNEFEEFQNITKQEEAIPSKLENITHRLEPDGAEYNYASASKGAKVVAHNKEAKGASNVLEKDHDKYLRNPCSVGEKFVVIELAEETLVDAVKIANFEHYSSNFKEFELYGSLSYPTETWFPLGSFVASNVRHTQSFNLPEPKWVRYLKLNLVSHYGSEFYCTLSLVEVYGIDAIERMLEDLIVTSEESLPNKLTKPNSTTAPLSEKGLNGVETDGVKIDSTIDDAEKLNVDMNKIPIEIPDPVMELRQQQPTGRIPGDTVLKILMQKVRSLELNLSVLGEYIKEMNRREGDALPELDKEVSKISLLLERSKTEMEDLLEWKETTEKGFKGLQSWKDIVSSQMDELARENSLLRFDVEKISRDQASMENKEVAVVAVSLCFMCFAVLKLLGVQVLRLFGSSLCNSVCETSRGWLLILVSSSVTIFITVVHN